MRRHAIGSFIAACAVCAALVGSGADIVAATTPPDSITLTTDTPATEGSTDPSTTEGPTSTMAPATRGSTIQMVSTLAPPPPPTTVAPPPTTTPSPLAVPANSGSGRRVVYSKSRMRVWIIDGNENVLRTYLVSGRFSQPSLGTYSVFSRSAYTCHLGNSHVCMRWMVRFAHGPSGDNIGFHEIPRRDGVPMQSDSQLGQALSSGCVRQSTADAQYMWAWAYIGSKVVVIW